MNAALIPVRGGSKSIPLKNIKEICGHPLVYWTVKAACECMYIDEVYVSTDSDDIKSVVETFGFSKVRIIPRSPETATDTASTESVMLEFADNYSFEKIALIQATSPLLTGADLDRGFKKLNDNPMLDSILSVVEQKRFNWQENTDGVVNPINYDVYNRPRRQDFDGYLVENGAFYITSKELLQKSKNRISGNIGAVKMTEESYYEIDEPADWIIAEAILRRRLENTKQSDSVAANSAEIFKTINNSVINTADSFTEKLQNIKLLATDCDGCLTDGGMYYSENGDEMKRFNTKDGMGFRLLQENGIKTAIITGEDRELNKRRAEKLHIDILKMGVQNKLDILKEICSQENISLNEAVYIGDDINDLECIKAAGVGIAVSNAEEAVKEIADYITKTPGGSGAIREAANIVLSAIRDTSLKLV